MTQRKVFIVSLDSDDGDNPYGDILVKQGQTTVARFPQDDAPVRDWNTLQMSRAVALASRLAELQL